jgi:hypothetical protein
MKNLLIALLLACSIHGFSQSLAASTIETYVGQDKAVLTKKLAANGYVVSEKLQYLSAEVASKIGKLTRRSCKGITLKKSNNNSLLFIVYDDSGKCVSFSQGFETSGNGEFTGSEKDILAAGYTPNGKIQTQVKAGERRIYRKGQFRFLLLHNEPKGGHSITCFRVR